MPAAIEQPISVIGRDLINDLSALPENEDIIIDFLLERLQCGQIYTWVGSLLLTLNPNNEVSTSGLYSCSEFDKHINQPDVYRTNPHIFTVAAKAHYNLTKELGRNCQVIIISGETGTGKTFNACKCLEFLSKINKSPIELYQQGDYMYDIMQQITNACRLVSAFATACTEKNEVSSRHGQLVRLHYKNGVISGATINSFLLERSRVTKGSCNFQIFYQMMFGMSHTELETFYLSKDGFYDILNVTDSRKKKYFQDSLQDTLKAIDVLGFKPEQKKHIFQVLALLIHLGNIQFIADGETCTIDLNDHKSREAVQSACALSTLSENTVMELLTTILINPQSTWRKHTSYHRNLVTIDACRNRLHSIIRHIYDLLFHWILNHINNTLSIKQEYTQWLGILDIFGFESFDKNGIEQLCVNYANEKMQQYFIATYMENSRNDLQEEGFIQDYNSPRHTIHLYQERLSIIEENLFLTLNDACLSPMTINVSTVIQLALKNSHNVGRKFLKEAEGNFVIEHYCGPVSYSAEDLLAKNTDKVPTEIALIFNGSRNKFLRSLINIEEEQHLRTVKMSSKRRTMLSKLKYNMDTLIKELSKCDLHYVRCVRPNRLRNGEWDRKDFHKQLACIGVFDALPLAKCKYPIRLCYRDFYQRYSKKPAEIFDGEKCKLIVESIASKRTLEASIYFGKQLIFLTESIFHTLETYRRNYRARCADKIKKFWLKHRRKTVPAVCNYLTINYQARDERRHDDVESVTPVKMMLDRELRKSNTPEENDDVFITSPLFPPRNTKMADNEDPEQSPPEKKRSAGPRKVQHELENWQKRYGNLSRFKYQFEAENCFKSSLPRFIKKIHSDQFFFKHKWGAQDESVATNCCNDANNNPLEKHAVEQQQHGGLHVSLADNELMENRDGEKCCSVHYNMEKNFYTIQVGSCSFFYKNGILSRRRLAAIPIRMHTRPTCLINSHVLPHNESPQGLQDCL